MTALAPITPKLVKLIPLLGTDKDGEIIGTVHAIRRTLESAGCDLHDLALVVERASLPMVVEQPRQEASAAPELKPWQLLAMHCIRAGTQGHGALAGRALGEASSLARRDRLGARVGEPV